MNNTPAEQLGVHIQADGECVVVSCEDTTIQIPVTNLQTVRRTVKQAYETKEDQYAENGGFELKISHHSVSTQCDHCSKCGEQVMGITVGLPNRSVEWEHIENGVKWCKPCAKDFTQTVEHELETNPGEYLGHTL